MTNQNTFKRRRDLTRINPQPLPPGGINWINPQPLPPGPDRRAPQRRYRTR
ncbi:hypothetical protein HUN08_05470 [Gordonia sp. X0973]|uniref:hypothetical protein n=1 Tax=Gordonia sp. X0973 TaxID=2742602 RepID=UPI0013EE3E03|nr:hypothetical protein [Gordonia sp. X0973]QKT06698.1 hypothetical protein HUN08_05470 [Gordonia sp. X0973]